MDSPLWIYCIGLIAQVFFTLRVLVQWFASEKSKKVESPAMFWMLSIIGSGVFIVYGILRKDLSITLGEFVSFYIYVWNINTLGMFKKTHRAVPWIVSLIPLIAVAYILGDVSSFKADFLPNENMPLALLIFGLVGQTVYKLRFVVQWVHSYRRKESTLPMSFWTLAIAGSVMLIVYGLIRHDWVLVAGQVSIVPSIRNVMIGLKQKKDEKAV